MADTKMDSLKVSSTSFASMGAMMWDAIPWILMVIIGILILMLMVKEIFPQVLKR